MFNHSQPIRDKQNSPSKLFFSIPSSIKPYPCTVDFAFPSKPDFSFSLVPHPDNDVSSSYRPIRVLMVSADRLVSYEAERNEHVTF